MSNCCGKLLAAEEMLFQADSVRFPCGIFVGLSLTSISSGPVRCVRGWQSHRLAAAVSSLLSHWVFNSRFLLGSLVPVEVRLYGQTDHRRGAQVCQSCYCRHAPLNDLNPISSHNMYVWVYQGRRGLFYCWPSRGLERVSWETDGSDGLVQLVRRRVVYAMANKADQTVVEWNRHIPRRWSYRHQVSFLLKVSQL